MNSLHSPVKVLAPDGSQLPAGIAVSRQTHGTCTSFTIENNTNTPQRIGQIILLDVEHGLSPETRFHGEGFSMFSQTMGTIARPEDVDPLTDRGHYRLPEPEGFRTVYGMMRLTTPDHETLVFGFTSCHRFVGKFHVNATRLQIVLQTENLLLAPGQQWKLEELMIAAGNDKNALLQSLANRILSHHPRLPHSRIPTGWCSWYCYGPDISEETIRDNLAAFSKHLPGIQYIQIDDGYQPWMGDWLATTNKFPQGMKTLTHQIRSAGFEPAIWVAPFIASPESELFQKHPDWFVRDQAGTPLRSDTVTFGGWRQGPWYMLDGSHPEAQRYLEHVFRTMSQEWGCTYFKLDANIWGAMPFGVRYNPHASSVEAYRQGMAAVRRGAGKNAFLLGCNHPLWPSLGEIHGCRTSMDIGGDWSSILRVARENLLRNWQNNRLWWNDPDCLKLDLPGLPANQKQFHLAATFATGGMLLSGDAVIKYSPSDWDLLRRAAANPGQATEFENDNLEQGSIRIPDGQLVVLLNWAEQPQPHTIQLSQPSRVTDFWSGKDFGIHHQTFTPPAMLAQSGAIYRLQPV